MSRLHLAPATGGDAASPAPPTAMDMTGLVVGLADRYRADGRPHPVAAATAVSARGLTGLDRTAFAARFGLTVAEVDACESGRVAFGDLPPGVGAVVEESGRVDLLHLAGLDDVDLEAPADRAGFVDDAVPGPSPLVGTGRAGDVVDVAADRWRARTTAGPHPGYGDPDDRGMIGQLAAPVLLAMVRPAAAGPAPDPGLGSRAGPRMRELALWTISDYLATDPFDQP